MRATNVVLTTALLCLPLAGIGQTVTVNKSEAAGGMVFNTIADALLAVQVDPTTPDVIQITDSEVYEEVISITSPVEIVGTSAERPRLELIENPLGGFAQYPASGAMPAETHNRGGIVINLPDTMSTGTVKLRNLIVMPQLGVPVKQRLRSAVESLNNNVYLEIDNCLFAPNDNHQPLVTNGVDSHALRILYTQPVYDPNIIPFGAHGIVMGRTNINGVAMYEGDGAELLLKDTVMTHFRNDYHPVADERERFPTIIVMHPAAWPNPNIADPAMRRITRVIGDSALSFARVGISASGDLELNNDGNGKIHMLSHGNQAIRLDGPAANYRIINDVNFSGNSNTGILDRGFGNIRFSMRKSVSIYTLNSIIDVNTDNTVGGTAEGEIFIEESTLVGGRNHPSSGKAPVIHLRTGTQCDIIFRNSILGGKMNHADPIVPADPENVTAAEQHLMDLRSHNNVSLNGANTATLDHTVMINHGPYAFRRNASGILQAFNVSGTSEVIGWPPPEEDPDFAQVDPNFSADPIFLDVRNSAFATLHSNGGPLSGGADYNPNASVQDWTLY